MTRTDSVPARTTAFDRAFEAEARTGFDAIARLASRAVGAQVGLVSFVGAETQRFAGAVGLPEPWQSSRETPLSHSFCRHVVLRARPLVVADARADPLLSSNLAVDELGVVAYAGVPLRGLGGEVLGSVCAIEHSPRVWDAADLGLLEDAARLASTQVQLLTARATRARADGAQESPAEAPHHALEDVDDGMLVFHRAFDELTRSTERARADQLHRGEAFSHEILTPLLSARMLCEDGAAALGLTPVEALEQVAACLVEARGVLDAALVRNRRPWTGEPAHREDVDLAHFLVTLEAVMGPLVPPGVTLQVDPPGAGAARAATDRVKLGQVLRNVVANALRVSSGGRVHVATSRQGPSLRIRVVDTGPGIAEDVLPRIFDERFSGDHPGTAGLGLSISRQLMRGLGGDLAASSAPGRGATFDVTLPVG